MLHAGISELRRAFKAHRRTGVHPSPSDLLLTFYAAECGLKAVWLRRRRLTTTASAGPHLTDRGHDLIAWAKELRLPATLMQGPAQVVLQRDGSQIAIEAVHQAWRYGVQLKIDEERRLYGWIESICEWAAQEELR